MRGTRSREGRSGRDALAVSLPHFDAPCHTIRLMRRALFSAAVVAALGCGALFFLRAHHADLAPPAPAPAVVTQARPLAPPPPGVPPLEGIDLAHIAVGDDGATAPAALHRVARLTLDPELQRAAAHLMSIHHVPEAAMVLVNVASGRVLAYASHLEHGESRDLCAEATAPSASVFKIVTGAALIEDAGLSPDTRQCYSGGEQKILPSDLEDDERRDRWCTTLAGAMGHSTNAVFARLALRNLKPAVLEAMAQRFGSTSRCRSTSPSRQALFTFLPTTSALRAPRPVSGTRRSHRSKPPG